MQSRKERTEETKKLIVNAFIELLNIKDAAHINVIDIAKKAHVDRGTFYRYFENKQALIEDCEEDFLDKLYFVHKDLLSEAKKRNDYSDMSSFIEQILTTIEENIHMVNALLNKTGNISFQEKLRGFLIEQNIMTFKQLTNHKKLTKQTDILANYTSSAVLGVIKFWSGNYNTYEKSDIVTFINDVTLHGVINFIK
ncbi:TetR/AcrR family transcriptional regulator [Liquorilactobacillus hordei]|uniref:TetR/AcrR family transcriptional regulator n=1 Tax=Liquorilactobacillus hordei TaxID=468911 RepID=UPI0039EA779E